MDSEESSHQFKETFQPTKIVRARYQTKSQSRNQIRTTKTPEDEISDLNMSFESSFSAPNKRSIYPSSWRLWKPSLTGQERRRQEALAYYKEAQYQMLIKSRKLMKAFNEEDSSSTSTGLPADQNSTDIIEQDVKISMKSIEKGIRGEDGTGMDLVCLDEVSPKNKEFLLQKLYANALMIPEYLNDIPDNFASEWTAVPFPSGTRCILVARDQKTQIRNLDGTLLDEFFSCLPGGSPFYGYSKKNFTILDCIQVTVQHLTGDFTTTKQEICYFALDMMAWNGNFYYNCNSESRFWMKSSRIEETEGLDQINLSNNKKRNEKRIFNCKYYTCDQAGLEEALVSPHIYTIDQYNGTAKPSNQMDGLIQESGDSNPITNQSAWFNQNENLEFVVDGVMFYFNDMDYLAEQTPTMCVLPYQEAQKLQTKL